MTKKLGKYELIKELGRGGFAVVYQARDPELNRMVALKVLHPQLTIDPDFIQRFRYEAQFAARLNHPNIVPIYEVGEVNEQPYLAMAYISGQPLNKIMTQSKLPPQKAVAIVEQIAGALDSIHKQELVHRDVKPANIMINEDERAILLDFGIARAVEGTGLTRTGEVVGTAEYMAPEQAEAEPGVTVDWRADIYALGIVAYELLTGRPPFTGKSHASILVKHIRETPPKPTKLNPTLPPELEQPLLKALAKAKERRFQRASDFAAALRAGLRRPASASRSRWVWPIIGAVALVILLTLCLGVWVYTQSSGGTLLATPTTIAFTAPTPTPGPEDFQSPSQVPAPAPSATATVAAALPTDTPLPPTETLTATPTALPPTPTSTNTPIPPSPTPVVGWIAFQSNRDGNFQVYAQVPGSDESETCLTCDSISGGGPIFSPDGTLLAFVATEGGAFHLYVLDIKTRKATNLTLDSAEYFHPAWSPDSASLVFASDRENTEFGDEICVIKNVKEILQDFNGINVTCLTKHPADDRAPNWSPDGKYIAFASNRDTNTDDAFDIYLFKLDTSEQTRLLPDFNGSGWPVWSPDGLRLAFHSLQNDNWEIYIVNKDGSELRNLTQNSANDQHPTWSPDGTRLAFDSDRDNNLEIYYMIVDENSPPINLTKNPETEDKGPSWGSK